MSDSLHSRVARVFRPASGSGRGRRHGLSIALLAALVVLSAGDAFGKAGEVAPVLAYIDPGAGTLLLQLVIAGFAGAAFYFRRAVARLLPGRKSDVEGEGEARPEDAGTE